MVDLGADFAAELFAGAGVLLAVFVGVFGVTTGLFGAEPAVLAAGLVAAFGAVLVAVGCADVADVADAADAADVGVAEAAAGVVAGAAGVVAAAGVAGRGGSFLAM